MSLCCDNLKAAMSATRDFQDSEAIIKCSDEIMSACNLMDDEGRQILLPHMQKLQDIKSKSQSLREAAQGGDVAEDIIAPYMKNKDVAGKKILRALLGLGIGIVALIIGLCVLYATDSAYIQAHKALGYFGIIVTAIAVLFLAVGIYNFIGYCIIYSRYGDMDKRSAKLQSDALAKLDADISRRLKLVDMLIAAGSGDKTSDGK
ncbi:MAG: hypothetical protein K2I79_04170 [Clostridia bacterium]|nr:hypothetical protein [Clostridia bacterium]